MALLQPSGMFCAVCALVSDMAVLWLMSGGADACTSPIAPLLSSGVSSVGMIRSRSGPAAACHGWVGGHGWGAHGSVARRGDDACSASHMPKLCSKGTTIFLQQICKVGLSAKKQMRKCCSVISQPRPQSRVPTQSPSECTSSLASW
jgi:hypothetical protein